jgi:hypothetical protein
MFMRKDDPFAELIRSLEESLDREGEPQPPSRPPRRPSPPPAGSEGNPRRLLWILLPLLLLLLFNRIIRFYADWFWYDSLELSSVYLTRIWSSFGLFAVGALVAWLFYAANILLARRLEPHGLDDTPIDQIAWALGVRITSVVLWGGAIFALLMGVIASNQWEGVLLYLNQHDFGLMVPIFQRDVSFFLFSLPVWSQVRTWLLLVGIVTLVATALVAGLGWRGWRANTAVLTHLAVLAALLLALFAWGYRLDAYRLVYSERGAVFGAGYTDVNAQLPAYNLLSIVTLIAAVTIIVTVFLRQAWRAMVAVLVTWGALAILAGNLYPAFIQRFQVSPNELNLERDYIANNIAFTRAAFDLDQIEKSAYQGGEPLTAAALRSAPETVRNIRLWDYRPLLQTYNQVQALTQYYEFNDVDVDRYVIDGQLSQVMLSARELVQERLNQDARTWVNRKLVYTHGYGVAMSPVAQVTRDGLPTFLLKDLPVQGVLELTQPQIYFGEKTNDYVIGRTSQPEFDYSRGNASITTTFAAHTGIDMSWGTRLLFAIHFADINLLLNQDIQRDSQLLWRRNIVERVQELAPFLQYDRDPYLVISDDGKLYWFLDAYTTSSSFPYSEPLGQLNGLNYIRNSVKIVTSAYDGSVHFYVVNDQEPIIAAYRRIFPDLFASLSDMPADLKQHVRYPSDLFTVQAEIYRIYHMTDPTEFYNKEDVWAWPEEIFENQPVRMEPYYVLMELPGSEDLDFIQILPFTPANRENMIAWLAIHNAPDKYGQKLVYEFGKESLVYGPKQVEARIDQDPVISSQLTLWNQQGSSVIRGNLLVIPIGDSLIYVEPLYLQAASGKIPELTRVIVATAEQVVMADNLGLALAELVGSGVLTEAGLVDLAAVDGELPPPTDGATASAEAPAESTLADLIRRANSQYANALTYQRNGDWAGYGREIQALQTTLERLAREASVEPASPTTEAAPTPTAAP